MQGTTSTLASSYAHLLPHSPLVYCRQSHSHLQAEADLVSAFASIIKPLCVAEVITQNDLPDIESLIIGWPAVVHACDRLEKACKTSSSTYGLYLSLIND